MRPVSKMEANKENVNKLKEKTKIPIPEAPLPALPKHLIHKKIRDIPLNEQPRLPLKTINFSDTLAGSSQRHEKVLSYKQNMPLNMQTKHVTLRERNYQQNWDYEVFKDKTENKDNSIISISDDDSCIDNDKNEYNYYNDNKSKNCTEKAKRAVTPIPKTTPLVPIRVKNIKRSLRRPHSRELQGLSPLIKPEKRGEEKFKRRLNFHDSLYSNLQSPDYFKKLYTESIERDYAKDQFRYLLSTERLGMLPDIPSISRACVLNWLMKVNGPDGNPAVIQIARWYLDSVLTVSSVDLEHLQPVATACYWIAQKLTGTVATASKLARCANNAFSAKRLMKAEKAILNRLKFPPLPVVPQDFIPYLAWCLGKSSGEIEVAATFICMCGMLVDKKLSTQLPSVIATSCVKNAILLLRKQDLMLQLINCPIFQAAEKKTKDVCSICSALRRAVRIVAGPTYEYKTPLEHFGIGPYFIAQKVVRYAKEFAVMDVTCTARNY